MSLGWGLALFCYLSLWDLARTSNVLPKFETASCRPGTWPVADENYSHVGALAVLYLQKPNSTTRPGFPRAMNTNDPGVRRAARFGVYHYNNSSNDIFLFKESHITKAMVQVVRGLKYMLNVEIGRTVCDKRGHSNLDSCDFQKKKSLQQMFRCYFEVWTIPWLQRVKVLLSLCH